MNKEKKRKLRTLIKLANSVKLSWESPQRLLKNCLGNSFKSSLQDTSSEETKKIKQNSHCHDHRQGPGWPSAVWDMVDRREGKAEAWGRVLLITARLGIVRFWQFAVCPHHLDSRSFIIIRSLEKLSINGRREGLPAFNPISWHFLISPGVNIS